MTRSLTLPRAVGLAVTLSCAPTATSEAGPDPIDRAIVAGGAPVTLLAPEPRTDEALAWRLDPAAQSRLLETATRAVTTTVPIDGRMVTLELERFEVVAPNAQFVVGSERRAGVIDPSEVVLYRGGIVGQPRSTAFLAISPRGVIAQLEAGGLGTRWVLGPIDGTRRGLAAEGLAFVESSGFGAPPLVEPCLVLPAPDGSTSDGVAGVPTSFTSSQARLVELAVETDHEFFTLFGDVNAANDYVVSLFGAVSTIYLREWQTRVMLTFVRIWDEPEELYDEPNPLGPFRDWWNEQMTDVPRDVAHLLTGRRNLPYGGVAYLSALCGPFAYAVNGYLNGSFADVSLPNSGNWDLVVVAHELGHNCGPLHTHDYGLDDCAGGVTRRGGILSYCHIVSGGVSNVDLLFETTLDGVAQEYLAFAECVSIDCDGNGVDDALDIAKGTLADVNGDGIPDDCQDCDGDGVLDPVAIANGGASDLDADGVPDSCQPDCNGNGRPDALDIFDGTSTDLFQDGIPDECERDCDDDGLSDITQIQSDMTLDVDRNRELDACQDCDGDGTPDLAQLEGGLDIWVGGASPSLRRFHGGSGAPALDSAPLGVLTDFIDAVHHDGRVLVSDAAASRVMAIDAVSGAALGDLIPSGGTGGAGTLGAPAGLLVTPEGTLLVASRSNDRILEFDAATGSFIRILVDGAPLGMLDPFGLAFALDGAVLVSSADGPGGAGSVRRFDRLSGASLGTLVSTGSGGLVEPRGVLALPDGSILVASGEFGAGLLRYDGSTGAPLGRWDLGGVVGGTWGLRAASALRLAADGQRVFASNAEGGAAVHSYDVETGNFLRSYYILSLDIQGARALVEVPPSPVDCNLNLTPDACDIATGRSQDRNADGIPDECQDVSCATADLNCDGAVDGADLGLLLAGWGACPRGGANSGGSGSDGAGSGDADSGSPCPADLDGNGIVDGADLGALLAAWAG